MKKLALLILIVASVCSAANSVLNPKECSPPGFVKALTAARSSSILPLSLKTVSGSKGWGPTVEIAAEANTRNFDEIKEITLGQFNVLNLVKKRGVFAPNEQGRFIRGKDNRIYEKLMPEVDKTPEQIQGVADTIKRAKPDILSLEEVEDLPTVQDFSKKYLDDAYHVILIEGNDARGIDVALLVRKDLPFDIQVQSFKNIARNASDEHLFSRDLPVMTLRKKGSPKDSKPVMVIGGTHYKSQRDHPGDPKGVKLRTEQVEATTSVLKAYEEQFGKDVPTFLMGDFNADIRQGNEFKALWEKAGLSDTFDLAPAGKTVPIDQRITQSYHPRGAPSIFSQLDSISGNTAAKQNQIVKEAQVMSFLDKNGNPKPPPRSYSERENDPSDHRMLRTVIDFEKIRNLFSGTAQP